MLNFTNKSICENMHKHQSFQGNNSVRNQFKTKPKTQSLFCDIVILENMAIWLGDSKQQFIITANNHSRGIMDFRSANIKRRKTSLDHSSGSGNFEALVRTVINRC
jgi:hypothetical protein